MQIGGVTIQVETSGGRSFSDKRDIKRGRGGKFGGKFGGESRGFAGKDYSRLDKKGKKGKEKGPKGDKKKEGKKSFSSKGAR